MTSRDNAEVEATEALDVVAEEAAAEDGKTGDPFLFFCFCAEATSFTNSNVKLKHWPQQGLSILRMKASVYGGQIVCHVGTRHMPALCKQ